MTQSSEMHPLPGCTEEIRRCCVPGSVSWCARSGLEQQTSSERTLLNNEIQCNTIKRNVNMPLHTLGVPEAAPDGIGRPKGQSQTAVSMSYVLYTRLYLTML